MESTPTQALAAVVQDAVSASGKTLREIAEATRIPLVSLHRKLHADRPITYPELVALAKALDTTPAAMTAAAEGHAA
jgi:plasmid maintenance system antidote protein VapI